MDENPEMDENALIRQAQAGDSTAWRRLFDTHHRKVFNTAYRFLGNRPDAEDVLQETFVRAYRGLDSFDPSYTGGFSCWISRIGANCSFDALRRRKRNRETLSLEEDSFNHPADASEEADPLRTAGNSEIRIRITEAVAGLTPKQRLIFTLRHYEGYTTREIAGMVAVSEGSVKTQLFRAVRTLRRKLRRLTPLEDRHEM